LRYCRPASQCTLKNYRVCYGETHRLLVLGTQLHECLLCIRSGGQCEGVLYILWRNRAHAMTHCCAQQSPDLPQTCIQVVQEQECQMQLRLNPVQTILHLPASQLRDDAPAVVRGYVNESLPVGKVVRKGSSDNFRQVIDFEVH
jgi:hypothetical protein